jgi:hypothetical protein
MGVTLALYGGSTPNCGGISMRKLWDYLQRRCEDDEDFANKVAAAGIALMIIIALL